jgi:hypothetical protein
VETIHSITEDQWTDFAFHIDDWLKESEATGQPLELCHHFVAHMLGYRWEVDFSGALTKYHAQCRPAPSFRFELVKGASLLHDVFYFFPSTTSIQTAE